jgi:hypothetical protein
MILSSAFRRFALPLFGALGMVGVLSCCSGASNTSALPDVKPASLTSASQVRLPLDSLQPTFAQQTLVGNAVTKLADRCLSQRGFSAGPAFLGHVDNPISTVDMSAVQWLTVQAAEKYGFNQPPGYTTYYELVWPGLPMQLEEEAVNETEADPHAAAVTSAWRSCMQQEGYKYASPADALADPRWASGTVAANALSANRGPAGKGGRRRRPLSRERQLRRHPARPADRLPRTADQGVHAAAARIRSTVLHPCSQRPANPGWTRLVTQKRRRDR